MPPEKRRRNKYGQPKATMSRYETEQQPYSCAARWRDNSGGVQDSQLEPLAEIRTPHARFAVVIVILAKAAHRRRIVACNNVSVFLKSFVFIFVLNFGWHPIGANDWRHEIEYSSPHNPSPYTVSPRGHEGDATIDCAASECERNAGDEEAANRKGRLNSVKQQMPIKLQAAPTITTTADIR